MKRKGKRKAIPKLDKRVFSNTAQKVHVKNLPQVFVQRGGFRL